ncbi:exonuclease [Alkalispirochaeta odontotermitis]|nr:exonuclease [Alkalispirochaeta odontotermitis]CAB1079513.1 Metallo-beta-lactamase family protein, RNA-specific [Olavius algarvensis Delta 1 endosymbiont]
MHITCYGAVREVTGSMHLITTEHDRVLLDCGMFQGRRRESAEKNKVMPFDPNMLTNVVLSHAHIDHSGRLPLLAKHDFVGRIICTRATAAACEYLLLDAAHIQESDANYLNYKTVRNALSKMASSKKGKKATQRGAADIRKLLKKNRHRLDVAAIDELIDRHRLERVSALYTTDDAQQALTALDGYPYRHPISIGRDMTCTLYEAGHILGSAFCMIHARENGRDYTICYTGDIGRFDKPIIKDPTLEFEEDDREIDLLIMESTYGNRQHEPVIDIKPRLKEVLLDTHDRGGTIMIPSFAFGRTQELLYVLHELYNENEVPRLPVYVDSPLATKITRVFAEHPEVYDEETHATFLQNGQNPFQFKQIHFVGSVEESMALNRDQTPHIVVSASGMCEAGRILHHLRHKIHDPKNTILIVGYMARHTLGRRILEQGLAYEESGRQGQAPLVKFMNKEYPLKARVVRLGGFSAHADKSEMLRLLKESNLTVKKIALVHGEEDQTMAFAESLKKENYPVIVPQRGESIEIK